MGAARVRDRIDRVRSPQDHGLVVQEPDGSWTAADGRTIYYSPQRFVDDILNGDCCFICGVSRDRAAFNDEHVVPDWILRRFALHDHRLRLPSGTSIAYGQHKLPCCQRCNTNLSASIEGPVSALLGQDFRGIANCVRRDGPWLIYQWLALLFLKTHLADARFRWHLDRRKGDLRIGAAYSWERLHHVHAIARMSHSGVRMNLGALGSLWMVQAETGKGYDPFDFGTLFDQSTVMLRIGDSAIVAVLDDAGASQAIWRHNLIRITGPIYPHQHRELAARLGHINRYIRNRPIYEPQLDAHGRLGIGVQVPHNIAAGPDMEDEFRRLLQYSVSDLIEGIVAEDTIRRAIQRGFSFLLDDFGRYRAGSWTD